MSDTETIPPALTPEQWAAQPTVYFRPPDVRPCVDAGCIALNRGPHTHTLDDGYGMELQDDGGVAVWDGSWGLQINHDVRHAGAAILLYGQTYGFTPEEAEAVFTLAQPFAGDPLEGMPPAEREAYVRDLMARARSAAEKIAALLPSPEP